MRLRSTYLRSVATFAVCDLILSCPFAPRAEAAVFPDDPARFWPLGVVRYGYETRLWRQGICTPEDTPASYCDTINGNGDCDGGQTCVPIDGRCVPGTLPAWGACHDDIDCATGGVCNKLSGRCLGSPLPVFATCDPLNPVACGAGESCVPATIANPCIAMKLWAHVANLTFIEVGCFNNDPWCPGFGCEAAVPSEEALIFRRTLGDPASSSIGIDTDSTQSVGVNPEGNFAWGFVHEVGHALGVNHEMQRDDRDTFIDVYTSRVVEGKAGNYDVEESSYYYPVADHGYAEPFDFDSIMMYPLCVYSDCNYQYDEDGEVIIDEDTGEPVPRDDCDAGPPDPCCDPLVDNACRPIDPIDEWSADWIGIEDQIGQRSHFSKIDALVMSFLYPESNWRFVDWTSPFDEEEGTFLRPDKTFLGGVDSTPSGGTLWVQPGGYEGVATYDKPMTIRAPIGPVHVGG